MSFYRSFIAAFAVMGFVTSAYAVSVTEQNKDAINQPSAVQTADASKNDANQANTEQQKVNINTATAKELMKVKGINAAKAKAIVTYRTKHGDFKSVDDLRDVKGFKKVSEKTMKRLQDQLTTG